MPLTASEIPNHLSAIRALDFTGDILADPLGGPWCRLGAWSVQSPVDSAGVEEVVFRQSLLVPPGTLEREFEHLDAVGNVLGQLGNPGGQEVYSNGEKHYTYVPFHSFDFRGGDIGEPLVFTHSNTMGVELVVNPDIWLYFGLEEREPGSGIWWDPRHSTEALIRKSVDGGNVLVVELQTAYLRRYLRARQLALMIGHYRHLHLHNPSPEAVDKYVEGDLVLGNPTGHVRAVINNWGLRKDMGVHDRSFLQRRLHLWVEVLPPKLDANDPWGETISFDPFAFTLPTSDGEVAPARWLPFSTKVDGEFAGVPSDFLRRVYFRQEVLGKYQGSYGFEIADDGSVTCAHYWGLNRSTSRIGNELIATFIGDFAEGVPMEEWPHWKQYAVSPPSPETEKTLREEIPIPNAVARLFSSFDMLNIGFEKLAWALGIRNANQAWSGSEDSLACVHLKYIYPASADDSEFLKRATLLSTLVLDGLDVPMLREVLTSVPGNLHMTNDDPPRPLGSRNLLQRLALLATLGLDLKIPIALLGEMVLVTEAGTSQNHDEVLRVELWELRERVRGIFAPLAMLYDLRTHGGLAHPPSPQRAAEAAASLGLPRESWQRRHYLQLLEAVTQSIFEVGELLEEAACEIQG